MVYFGLALGQIFGALIARIVFARLLRLKKIQYFFFYVLIGAPFLFLINMNNKTGGLSWSNLINDSTTYLMSMSLLIGAFIVPSFDRFILQDEVEALNDPFAKRIYYMSKRFISAVTDFVVVVFLIFIANMSMTLIVANVWGESLEPDLYLLVNILIFLTIPTLYFLICDRLGRSIGKYFQKLSSGQFHEYLK